MLEWKGTVLLVLLCHARGIVGHQGPHNGTSERVARLVLPDAAQLGRQQLIAAPCKGVIVEQTCFRLMATTMSS
jgi:hypothetical protein